jgi:hypothetical protein
MERIIGGAENDAAVEYGKDFLRALRHRSIPQLEMASEFFSPVLVQIKQQVDAPIKPESLILVEVGVDP